MSNEQTTHFNMTPDWMQTGGSNPPLTEQQVRAIAAEEVTKALAVFKTELDEERRAREEPYDRKYMVNGNNI